MAEGEFVYSRSPFDGRTCTALPHVFQPS